MATEISYTKVLYDFRAKRNDTFRVKAAYSQKISGVVTPEDISASDFKMRIATLPDGGTTILNLVIGAGLSIANTNQLVISLTALQMNIPAGIYYYDIERIYPDGTVSTRPQGRFIVEADVTI